MIQIRKDKRKIDNKNSSSSEEGNGEFSSNTSVKPKPSDESKTMFDIRMFLKEDLITKLIILLVLFILFIAVNIYREYQNRRNALIEKKSAETSMSQHSIEQLSKPVINNEEIKAKSEKGKSKKEQLKELNSSEKGNFPKLLQVNQKEILGMGANGTVVFNGFFQHRNVAIKRVLSDYYHLVDAEIKILLKVDHPNIIKYFYVEETK